MALGIVAGIKIGTSIIGGRQQKKAGQDAQAIADENAERTKRETEETIRRTGLSQEQSLSGAQAAQAGSGIRSGAGTSQTYLDEMQKTFQSDLDWIQESGASQESIQRAEGRLAKQQGKAQAWGTVASGVNSALSLWK